MSGNGVTLEAQLQLTVKLCLGDKLTEGFVHYLDRSLLSSSFLIKKKVSFTSAPLYFFLIYFTSRKVNFKKLGDPLLHTCGPTSLGIFFVNCVMNGLCLWPQLS